MGGSVGALGRGAIAGLAGTAVMTVSQRLEMSLSGRPPSPVPGQVGVRLLRRKDEAADTLSPIVHWAHGTTMGTVRALFGQAGLRGPAATAAFFALLWSGDVLLYKSLGVADWPWRWSMRELAPDVGHKALYAAVTGMVYDALSERDT